MNCQVNCMPNQSACPQIIWKPIMQSTNKQNKNKKTLHKPTIDITQELRRLQRPKTLLRYSDACPRSQWRFNNNHQFHTLCGILQKSSYRPMCSQPLNRDYPGGELSGLGTFFFLNSTGPASSYRKRSDFFKNKNKLRASQLAHRSPRGVLFDNK